MRRKQDAMCWMRRAIRLATALALMSAGGCGLGLHPGISPFGSARTAAVRNTAERDAGSSKGASGITSKSLPAETSDAAKSAGKVKSADAAKSAKSTGSAKSVTASAPTPAAAAASATAGGDRKTSEDPTGVRVVRLPEQPKLPERLAEDAPVAELLAELTADLAEKSPVEKSDAAPDVATAKTTSVKAANETESPKTDAMQSAAGAEPVGPPSAMPLKNVAELLSETLPPESAAVSPAAFAISIGTLPRTESGESDFVAGAGIGASGGEWRFVDTRLADDRLSVRNLALVRQVKGFGQKMAFDQASFTASQAVIVYAEIDRFESLRTADGYYTAMRGTVVLRDAAGRVVLRVTPGLAEETCDSPRRDYYLAHVLRLPATLVPGRYTLEFAVEDTCSGRSGTATMTLRVE